eukprot:936425_1
MDGVTEEKEDTDAEMEGLNPPEVENIHATKRATRLALRRDTAKKAEYVKAQRKQEEEAAKKKKQTKKQKKITKTNKKTDKTTETETEKEKSEKNTAKPTTNEWGGQQRATIEINKGKVDQTEVTDGARAPEEKEGNRKKK